MYDVIIIGAGPSGLMTAIAVANNLKILILEKNNIAGKKMLLTGGGRCNLTNLKSNNVFLDVIEYNKKYLYSAINKFGPSEICNFFETNGVLLKEEKDNQIFPISDKASSIVNFLVNSLDNVKINYNEFVTNIINNGKIKEIQTNKGEYFTSNIVIATGGNSYQKTGSCGDHMKFAKMLKQPTISLYPAEVGIILEEELDLAGTAVENVEIIYKNYKKRGNLLFTHHGLSGSAIMKISEFIYLNEEKTVIIDLILDKNEEEIIAFINSYDKEKSIGTCLNCFLSKRLVNYLLKRVDVDSKKILKCLVPKEINAIASILKKGEFLVKSTCDFDLAYVTGGGIDMKYIDSTTMESKINKGIYFVGEALDIHGPIGGYNITLALSTGFLAGSSLKKEENIC